MEMLRPGPGLRDLLFERDVCAKLQAAEREAEATDLRYTSEQILADARALYVKRDLPRLLD